MKIFENFWKLIMGIVEINDINDFVNIDKEEEKNNQNVLIHINNLYESSVNSLVKNGFEDIIKRTCELDSELGAKVVSLIVILLFF